MISTISITGVDKDSLLAKQASSRVLLFSDGVARHFTLKNYQWAIYDQLIDDGWTEDEIHGVPFDEALAQGREGIPFEDELRLCFDSFIRTAWPLCSPRQSPPSNNY